MKKIVAGLMLALGSLSAHANFDCIVTMASGQQYIRSQPHCVTTAYANTSSIGTQLARLGTVALVGYGIYKLAEAIKENKESEQTKQQAVELKRNEEKRRRSSVLDEKLWKDAENRLLPKLTTKEDKAALIECPRWNRLFATTDQATIDYWTPKYNETCSNLLVKDYGNSFVITVESFVDSTFKESHEVMANSPSEAVAIVKAKYEFGVIAYIDLLAMADK
jgi:hypothetical protein